MGGGNGRHPEFVTDLETAAFENIRDDFRSVDTAYTRAAWRGRIRASAGIGASLHAEAVRAFDAELSSALDALSPVDPILVPHGLYVAVGSKPRRPSLTQNAGSGT